MGPKSYKHLAVVSAITGMPLNTLLTQNVTIPLPLNKLATDCETFGNS